MISKRMQEFRLVVIMETIILALFPGKTIPFERPELKELATRMNVEMYKKQPFSITDKKGVKAYSNTARKQVILGSEFVKSLEPDELEAVVAHELVHLKTDHSRLLLVAIVPICFALCYLILPFLHPIFIIITFSSSFLLINMYFSWKEEYRADLAVAQVVGLDVMIRVLKKLVPPERFDKNTEMNPSPKKRIEYLLNHYKNARFSG